MQYQKILICGLRNTGKTTLFWNLQKELGWPTFSVSQFLRDYMRIHGLQKASPAELTEHEIKMGQEIAIRLETLLTAENQVIIETRIFEHISKIYPDTLKVLLTTDDNTRISRNAFREGISPEKSAQRLIKKENLWLEKMNQQFSRNDFFDPKYFNLILDSSNLSPSEVVEKILLNLQSVV